ncbi:MAG: carboxypeptidase-like regulatory domain-containing protein, partial [Melioribacter sp.]|nr:carboxypeptidase-like regulatory domain-containing protein [Melioribacter sp.]
MKKNSYVFFLLIFLVTSHLIYSQGTGSVSGRVIDKSTKEPLIGANVVVLNTSLGAATDYEGKFVIHHIPVGKHTLQISYIGYETQRIDVDITT